MTKSPDDRSIYSLNIIKEFADISEYWQPKIIGELNEQLVKIAKFKDEFVWHKHDTEDELFIIVKGKIKIEFRNKEIELSENEMTIVPKGVEHKPSAVDEAWVMLLEPKTTKQYGN